MESNGVKGTIHVSQSTADELIKLGRQSWLVARPEKVAVKGKGEMQTYFLNICGPGTNVSTTRTSTCSDVDNGQGESPPLNEEGGSMSHVTETVTVVSDEE